MRRIAATVLALVLAAVLLQGCSSAQVAVRTVPVPPVSADAVTVVKAWLAAVNAGDEAAGRQLSTPVFAKADHDSADGWFANTLSLTDVRTSVAAPVTGLQSNKDYREVVGVRVAFQLEQKHEVSFQNGPVEWGFILVRDSPSQRWRINEQGLG